jgi:ribonuclease R
VKESGQIAEIVHVLQNDGRKSMGGAQIATALKLRGQDRQRLQKVLGQMADDGLIVAARNGRYSLGGPSDLVTGRISVARSGDGFIDMPDGQGSVRVNRREMGNALPGDEVVVRIDKTVEDDGMHGKLVRVLKRGAETIVGVLKTTGKFLYVVPINPSYKRDFYVPEPNGARVDDRVVVRFTRWDDKHVNPEGEIIEVLGASDNPSLDTIAIIRQYEYAEEFPKEVLREVEKSDGLLRQPGNREDLRKLFVITIDPVDARDFDDGLSLEKVADGNMELGVHIADVSHFVRPGTRVDAEARRRGNSVYFSDKVLPMLPEGLSNGICSLVPDADRLAFSVFLTIDSDGRIVGRRFGRTIIRSKLRLAYKQALAVLEGRTDSSHTELGISSEQVGLLKSISSLAQLFRRRRFDEFALELDVPEYEIVVKADGTVSDIRPVENDISHQMVEECMIAANEAVDAELSDRMLPLIHRVHAPPKPEKIDDLMEKLVVLGCKPGDLHDRKAIARFLVKEKDNPLGIEIKTAVLRSMNRAEYSSAALGHYGLAKSRYAHFTSPIRRYPDLVVHRILAAMLEGARTPYSLGELGVISKECSLTEQRAEEAERALEEIKKYRLLEQEAGDKKVEPRRAVVVKAMDFGAFVELPDLGLQGLIHISKLHKGYVRYSATGGGVLRAGSRVFKVGTELTVRVVRVDLERRRVDFEPAPRA